MLGFKRKIVTIRTMSNGTAMLSGAQKDHVTTTNGWCRAAWLVLCPADDKDDLWHFPTFQAPTWQINMFTQRAFI